MSRLIVTVDGIDGSGKSTFAVRLADALAAEGLEPLLVRVDDFRRPIDWASGNEAVLYYDRYFDLAGTEALVRAFGDGETVLRTRSFDGLAGRPGPDRTLQAGPAAALLVEGVFIRRIAWPAGAAHLYLDVSFDTGHQRVVVRDTARGRTPDEVEHRWAVRYRPAQERYMRECRPRESAAVVLENSTPPAPRLLRGGLATLPPPLARALDAIGVG